MSSLYILDINILSVLFENIFSHWVFFLLLIISLMSRNSKLIVLSVNFSIYFALTDRSKIFLLWLMPESVLPMFYSRNCLVSDLTFKYLIHFKFIFVYSMRKYSNIFVLHLVVYFSQCHLLKRMPFVCSYPLLCRLLDHRCVGFFLGSVLFHWSVYLYVCQYCAFFYICNLVIHTVRRHDTPSFVHFLQDCSGSLVTFEALHKF